MILGQPFEGGADPLDHHVDALGARGAHVGTIGGLQRGDRSVPLDELVEQDAVGLTGMLLAEAAVLTNLELAVAHARGDDLGRLVRSAHQARVEGRGVAELAGARQALAQQRRLLATTIGKSRAAVTGDDVVDVRLGLAVANEDDPRHARWSTKPSSW